MDALDFIEVETPMMQPIPGGAAARPFVTHHNALDIDMYLRIAPELYLKRLIVGGFERVYEINRNFRNEGLSTQHNPEFTMLELYWAYTDYLELMDLIERLLHGLADGLFAGRRLTYQGRDYDLGEVPSGRRASPSKRHCSSAIRISSGRGCARCPTCSRSVIASVSLTSPTMAPASCSPSCSRRPSRAHCSIRPSSMPHPLEASRRLSRTNDADPFITDRFEFFLAGRELANGFSELNDPEEQAQRFRAQVLRKDSGDDGAMHYDADYSPRARVHGICRRPRGLGLGVDRLVMFLTDSPSIRDVLLFPQLRPEA